MAKKARPYVRKDNTQSVRLGGELLKAVRSIATKERRSLKAQIERMLTTEDRIESKA